MTSTEDRPPLWKRIAGSTLVRLIGGFVAIAFAVSIAPFPFTLVARQSPRLSAFFHLTFLPGLIAAAAALLVYYWFVRWTERRRPTELANGFAPFGIGAGLTAIMFALSVGVLALLGSVHFIRAAFATAVATALAASLS